MRFIICFNTTYRISQHAKEECRASEEGRFGRPGPPEHHRCQGSRCDDSGWIFEVGRCKRSRATTSTTPSATYGWPEQESKGSCFCQRRRSSFIAVRHVVVGIVIVGIVILGIVILGIVIVSPNEPQAQTKADPGDFIFRSTKHLLSHRRRPSDGKRHFPEHCPQTT